jgi:hypothetical protein
MNAARTVPTATAVEPKTCIIIRDQTTWYISPNAPEKKNNSSIADLGTA